jgi:hypothetical protein
MSILKTMCDDCKKEITGRIYENYYDGIHRCKKCHWENELQDRTRIYNDEAKWVKEVYIKRLKELRRAINEAKRELALFGKDE